MAAVRHAYSPTTPISDQAPDPVLKSSEFGSAPWAYPADSISCRQVPGDRVIKVGIVGATGYTGVELLRLLVRHPGVQVAVITSRAEAGMAVADMYPSLRGLLVLTFTVAYVVELCSCDIILCRPLHRVS